MEAKKLVSFLSVFSVLAFASISEANIFVVNETGDQADNDPNDGVCFRIGGIPLLGDISPCTLRAALEDADTTAGPDEIHFNIGGTGPFVISPLADLPALADVTIDGTTQPGFSGSPLIYIDGLSSTSVNPIGLKLNGNAKILSLAVQNFSVLGLRLNASGDNTIQGAWILSNGAGVSISGNRRNVIGGTSTAQKNVISNNRGYGLLLDNSPDNVIIGNEISSNALDGIRLTGIRSSKNKIGGTAEGEGNVISSNFTKGVVLKDAGYDNAILGNSIRSHSLGIPIDLGDDGVIAGQESFPPSLTNNNYQNAPVLATASMDGCQAHVVGSLTTAPSVSGYRVEFFANDVAPAGGGPITAVGTPEADKFLQAVTFDTDAAGRKDFDVKVPLANVPTQGRWYVTATATSPTGSTSEISDPVRIQAVVGVGQLQWSSATSDVAENAGDVDVTIQRTCGSAGEASVTVTTADGTATAGSDYTALSQMVTFASGETEKTVSVKILNNNSAEAAEAFTVTLSSPTGGAELGVISQTTVTIADDDGNPSGGTGGSGGGCSLIRF